ncbi:MAG TPA: pantetheine-phosphate adenylyltransferase [Nitrosopumilaceae archaeon]|jgi:pantetheine-phosphate adenylyltransferase|nr:pantetheine-phosphate adenylyltransferase [Nitrosopumilaceae archaeon]
MAKFQLVALGGTFDILHKGHLALLQKGFSISSKVIIGLTSDELAAKKGKNLLHGYFERYHTLESIIKKNFPNSQFEISKLDNDFGPAVLEKEVEALVVSEETTGQGHILNKLRHERQLPPVEIVSVPMVLATDGKRISTSRIKDSEIDAEGNLR